jgi:hypothetical protein
MGRRFDRVRYLLSRSRERPKISATEEGKINKYNSLETNGRRKSYLN